MATTTWDQKSGMSSTTDVDNVETFVDQAEAAKDAAEASATAAATSATDAAASLASISDDADQAAASAAAAATSATSASTSATNAASSATTASSAATTATTKASEASTSAANAATSETNAATSATAAASSASSAQSSADAAAASYDDFDDRYLGAKASDPVGDNDGNALAVGALYFNTTDGVMKVYDGASWLAAYASLGLALQAGDNISELTNDAGYTTNTGTVTSVDLTAGAGISVSGGPLASSGSITVTNTAPDQTVVLTGGSGISTSGTYPNFTITNDAPDQTVVLSQGANISITGAYPNFTIASTDTNTTYTAGTGLSLSGTEFSIGASVVTSAYTGDVDIAGELIADSYNESYAAVTSTSNATTIDCETGNVFAHTLTENTTFTFSNPPATGTAYGFTLKLVQDSTARTVTWPASVDWAGATAPTISTGSGEVDVFVFFTHDGGTTWYGFTAGQVMS